MTELNPEHRRIRNAIEAALIEAFVVRESYRATADRVMHAIIAASKPDRPVHPWDWCDVQDGDGRP